MGSLKTIYQEMRHAFTQSDIENADLDAKYLIYHVTGSTEEDFILNADKAVSEDQVAELHHYTKRRLNNEPVSKIIGQKEFWGLTFKVNEHVLDPRPDSETLIEAVLRYTKQINQSHNPLHILDLGTGSGCLLITLLTELANAKGVGVDISDDALAVAQENAIRLGVQDRFIAQKHDWCAGINLADYDIIISNPPYIREDEIRNLSLEVQNHDPILALSGGKNGLEPYKNIFSAIKNTQNFKGHAFFEIGFDQSEEILRLVDDSNLRHCDSMRDIGGHVRCVEICRGDK